MLTGEFAWLPGAVALFATAAIAVKKKLGLARTLTNLTWVAYLTALLSLTFFPIPLQEAFVDIDKADGPSYNFIPFRDIANSASMGAHAFAVQTVGNVALFVPLGFLVPLVWRRVRSWQQVLLIVFLASLTIETLQFAISFGLNISYKVADVDDLMLNVLGGMLGYLFYRLCVFILTRLRSLRLAAEGQS